jgi:hypothetical protein
MTCPVEGTHEFFHQMAVSKGAKAFGQALLGSPNGTYQEHST